MKDKILEMKPVSLNEVKEILKARKSEKEFNYEQEQTFKYVEKFSKLTEKQTTDLLKALGEIEFLKEDDRLKYEIANTLPVKIEQLQLMIPKTISPSDEELGKVIELTKKFEDKVE